MMKLELKNLQSSKTYLIEATGAIFGREGGEADIKLPDVGISRKHAKVYARRGAWYLEDMNSAIGTFLNSQRIFEPTPLSTGMVFTLGRQQFEVLQMLVEEDEATDASRRAGESSIPGSAGADDQPQAPLDDDEPEDATEVGGSLPAIDQLQAKPSPPPKPPPGETAAEFPRVISPTVEEQVLEEDDEGAPPPRGAALPRAPTRRDSVRSLSDGALGTPAKNKDANRDTPSAPVDTAMLPVVPAQFLATLPKAIRFYLKVVPRLAFQPMTITRRAISALPVQGLGPMELLAYALPANLFAVLVAFLCALVVQLAHRALSLWAILPIGPLLAALVASTISAFVLHPVVKWVVEKLNGQSTARSRSNLYAMLHAGVVLTAIPNGLALLFGLIPLPFVNLVPILLTLLASLITTYVVYGWFRAFGTVRWFQNLLLVLGVIGCVGARVDQVITMMGLNTGAQVPEIAAAPPPEPTSVERDAEPTSPAPPPDSDQATAPEAPAPQRPEVAAGGEDRDSPPAQRKVSYAEYLAQREHIEKAIAGDPTLLRRAEGVLPLYERLHRISYDIEARYAASARKLHPSQLEVNTRLKDAEVFENTVELVVEIYAKLPRPPSPPRPARPAQP